MIPDLCRDAKLLVDKHGGDTPIRAAERAAELLYNGDIDGTLVWRQIVKAIQEVERDRRADDPLK